MNNLKDIYEGIQGLKKVLYNTLLEEKAKDNTIFTAKELISKLPDQYKEMTPIGLRDLISHLKKIGLIKVENIKHKRKIECLYIPENQNKKTTNEGLVYLIQNTLTKNVKIGFTQKNVNKRLKSLQTGSCAELIVLDQVQSSFATEQRLHKKFKEYKIRENGEWFLPNEEIFNFFKYYNKENSNFLFITDLELERELARRKSILAS